MLDSQLAAADVLRLRLAHQRLTAPLDDPAALVAHLGAVQSQDYAAACWALGLRLGQPRATAAAAIEAAFAAGAIVRTHVLRPTWHFVAPADIRWMLSLTGARIRASGAAYTRSLGLTESLIERCSRVIAEALRGGHSRSRAELGAFLREAGVIAPNGATLGNLLTQAELDALVCSGPRRGKQHTYMLLDERVPEAPPMDRDAALAELTWRYFASHGPALVQDCVWWSGLSGGEIRRGLESNAGRLRRATVDGRVYWLASHSQGAPDGTSAFLLPNYDEYTVAYRERDLYYDRAANATGDQRMDVPFRNVLLVDGQVRGRWSVAQRAGALGVELEWSIAPTRAQATAIERAAHEHAEFLGLAGVPSQPATPKHHVKHM
jgi:hypothetical protein